MSDVKIKLNIVRLIILALPGNTRRDYTMKSNLIAIMDVIFYDGNLFTKNPSGCKMRLLAVRGFEPNRDFGVTTVVAILGLRFSSDEASDRKHGQSLIGNLVSVIS